MKIQSIEKVICSHESVAKWFIASIQGVISLAKLGYMVFHVVKDTEKHE